MRVLHLASEVAPWVQTGGLGQVAGALPDALAAAGADVHVVCPLYPQVQRELAQQGVELADSGIDVVMKLGGVDRHGRFYTLARPGRAAVHFLECWPLYDRDGIYDGGYGPHGDNPQRFAFLARGAVDGSWGLCGGPPDIVHAHDWQAALAPVYLREKLSGWLPHTRSVLTINNLDYQGVCSRWELPAIGLDWSVYHPGAIEYWDQLNYLKAGIAYADAVTTVSERYAEEILTPAFGCHLDGFLREHQHKLSGVLNGIDTEAWDPATDPALAARYSADDPSGKAACRAALLAEAGMEAGDGDLVLGVVSRFASQKGLDLIADLAPELGEMGVKLIMLGSGEPALEARFAQLGAWFRDRVWTYFGWSGPLARRIYAGADAIAIPSRFEPCGLTQMYAMRYGAIPIAHAVGGLRDTVLDWGNEELARGNGTGIRFEHPTVEGLRWALGRALALYRGDRPGWNAAVAHVMQKDWSWRAPAARYLELYRRLLGEVTPAPG